MPHPTKPPPKTVVENVENEFNSFKEDYKGDNALEAFTIYKLAQLQHALNEKESNISGV